MHTGETFKIFQDRNDLAWGQSWKERIDDSIDSVTFLIPIITPSYFRSPACRSEFDRFRDREFKLGNNNLILPIYYLSADELDDSENTDDIGIVLRSRQYQDLRPFRFVALEDLAFVEALAELARDLKQRTLSISKDLAASATVDDDNDKQKVCTEEPARKAAPSLRETLDLAHESESSAVLEAAAILSESFPNYTIYTEEFDEIVGAETFLGDGVSAALFKTMSKRAAFFEDTYVTEIDEFKENLSRISHDESVLNILVDNSGSLRNKMRELVPWLLLISKLLDDHDIKTQIIGFTTRAWKGGLSREKWIEDGKKTDPGRLNDLRYIIYKGIDESWVEASQNFSVMAQEGILKENIDGEALLLGYCDLRKRSADHKFLMIISDGAPVDDSTLSVNQSNYLVQHLQESIRYIDETDVNLGAVGLEYDVSVYYGDRGFSGDTKQAGLNFFYSFSKMIEKVKGTPN